MKKRAENVLNICKENFLLVSFKNIIFQILIGISIITLFTSCHSDDSEKTYIASSKLALRQSPSMQGKFLSDIMVGEQVVFLDSSFTNIDTKRQYYKVELSDKKQGWALKSALLPLSRLAVTMTNIAVYKRPQATTKLPNDSNLLRLVLFDMTKEIDSFLPITSIYGTPIGWVRKDNIGSNDNSPISTKIENITTILHLIAKGLIQYNNKKVEITDADKLINFETELKQKGLSSKVIPLLLSTRVVVEDSLKYF